jgi:ectoine hydroxylase-related dioxygenase (phytanoyl-CoA dioxygenase family)
MFNKLSEQSFNKPWVETDFSNCILKKKKIDANLRSEAKFFIENGYLILKNVLNEIEIKNCLIDFKKIINSKKYKTNPDYFHYNKNPRIVEGWRSSNIIKKFAYQKKIIKYLTFFYSKKPIAFSTINFQAGTEQPLHSDYIHFGTIPELYLAGVWFALEKVDKNNGPLVIVPRSHKLPIIEFSNFNLPIPKSSKELKYNYTIYEQYVEELIKEKKLKKKQVYLNKGDAIIWAANLLHGGSKISGKNRTRYSQVVHYHFRGLKRVYNPCFSDKTNGIFADRDLKQIKIPS